MVAQNIIHLLQIKQTGMVQQSLAASFRLTLKAPTKIAADNILIFYFYLSKKIRLDFSCESSA